MDIFDEVKIKVSTINLFWKTDRSYVCVLCPLFAFCILCYVRHKAMLG